MQSPSRPIQELQSLAINTVQPMLEQATDVGSVNIAQTSQREVHVLVTPERLASYGITISQLSQAITNANVNIAAGFIQNGGRFYNVRLIGELTTVDEIRGLRLTLPTANAATATSGARSQGGSITTGSPATQAITTGQASAISIGDPPAPAGGAGGNIVALGDIATVVDAGSEATQDAFLNGVRGIGIDVLKTTNGNTLNAVESTQRQLQALRRYVPPDVTFIVSSDQSVQVHNNLNDVVASLVLGAILAVLVVFLFLHNPRGTIIIAIAIPVSMIATFGPLYILGFTLNSLTLLGLSLAVGILVDDSIVVLENINRHLALGEEPVEAAINGRSEIGYAALTLTAVDLVVFLPIAFMGGVIGEFFRSFGVTVAFATLFSLFVSFTLTPMMAARWYRKGERVEYETGFAGRFDKAYGRFAEWYRHVLGGAIRHPWLVLIAGNLALILVFIFVGSRIGFTFAPNQDQGRVSIQVQAAPGSSLAFTEGITRQIEEIIRSTPDLNNDTKFISTVVGDAGAGQHATGTHYAHVDLTLYDRRSVLDTLMFWRREHLRTRPDIAVAAEVRERTRNIVGARILPANVTGFGGGGAPVQVNLTGPDLSQLQAATEQVRQLVARTPGAYNVDVSYKSNQPDVEVRLDRIKAPEYGVDLQQVGTALSDSVAGNIDTKYRDPVNGQQYNIRSQLAFPSRSDPHSVNRVIVGYQNGSPIHLGDLAGVTIGAGPVNLQRYNRQSEIAVTAYLEPNYAPGTVSTQLSKQLATMDLGQVSYTLGGQAQSIQREGGYLVTAFLLGILLTYMLMASLFNNMLYPMSIMLSLPQAWVGALLALYIAGQQLSLISMIGIVLLNAIVNKNAILLVDYTNTLRGRGKSREDALLEAAPTRLRPILMTTLTILVSSLPTALALGRGAGFRQSLGVAVIGGITLSLILTLVIVPCAYILYDNFAEWLHRKLQARATAGRPATES
jgi:HAE1 family hydrophobic/amphiphilic exporter-1